MNRMLLACAIASAASTTAVAAAEDAQPPRAALEQFVCIRASNPLSREIAVTAVMRPVAGTERMALRFELQRSTAKHRAFVDVGGGDLGKWVPPPNPTLGQRPNDVWIRQKEVANLAAPAVYRLRVSFRWTGRDGHVLARVVRLSKLCDQPG